MDLEIFNDDNLIDDKRQEWVEDLADFAANELELDENTQLSIHFVTKDGIHEINKKYRDVDRATDVISFAINDGEDSLDYLEQQIPDLPVDLGDLFISVEIVKEHADEYEHSFDRELGYTIVHGILHLNGYDHIKPEDEKVMIGLQEKILSAYGLKK
ncbi:rRNA maturation RNase YbeY [Companilactobacillus sp.]|jgi:probable rRNA maturation factor|uniref:rRNA maturation RNase YbeY n=1 Tax=Companilactobacillus sp. TaxID=2767905 RepID=UPI0025C5B757|nr:rRNA maturation RNase YbeY [Companilactobacillus sp.]MCH4008217.1 rRNA maturation RNase YbeY [Companilactobacillus sp.]MCH4051604.1 rRNA maturation RNase YbeY [Companilactobacillus sp.]MCH4076160.1 rRNA maturation RNase YbeY [Companilactobacillus sp.]MCH4124735.1 rRNA maturation RNase YbeY [Companilactobacillus sp.]MCH4131277.1 rRNA maturation RNase YbeY [Companilactobacillus sp.]